MSSSRPTRSTASCCPRWSWSLQGVLGVAAFLLFATVLRVPEVNQVIGLVRRKVGR